MLGRQLSLLGSDRRIIGEIPDANDDPPALFLN